MIAIQMMVMRAMESLRDLRDEESGQGLVEYGLILGLVAVVAIGTLATVGTDVKTVFTDIVTELAKVP